MPDYQQTRDLTDLKVDQELIEQAKDKKEKETGVFHWMDANGEYQPVTDMSAEEIEDAISFSEKKMDRLQATILSMHKKMHAWQYRIDKLGEERERKFDGISSRAANQIKELTE